MSESTKEKEILVKTRNDYSLSPRQRTSYGNLKDGALITISLLPLAFLLLVLVLFRESFFVEAYRHTASTSARLSYTLKLQTMPVFLLQGTIIFVLSQRSLISGTRFRKPLSGYEYMVEKSACILTSTLEQLVGFEAGLFIFAVLCEDRFFYLVPGLVLLWCIGWVAFAAGYLLHPKYRIPGFLWIFLPTILLTVFNLLKWGLNFDLFDLIEHSLKTFL